MEAARPKEVESSGYASPRLCPHDGILGVDLGSVEGLLAAIAHELVQEADLVTDAFLIRVHEFARFAHGVRRKICHSERSQAPFPNT